MREKWDKKCPQQQYTHGAIWVTIAMALLNLNDKAYEYFKMINPIEHSKSKETANKYKVEPYVMAADVYGAGNLAGRGGWTWYTGSSSWMYVAGLKYILGINIEDGKLKIEPHVPSNWNEYRVKFKYENSLYNLKIKRIENRDDTSKEKMILINGEKYENDEIILDKSGKIYNVEIIY